MEIHSQIRAQYEKRKSHYERLKEEVIFILKKRIDDENILYEDIYGRVKNLESLQDKVNRKELTELFDEVSDICGVRIICLFPSDLHRIGEIIEDTFVINHKDDKISAKPAESFGYLSIHYIATLLPSYSGERYDDLKKTQFEIQLRTIAAHAWCTISHHLDYKNPNAVPSELQKAFHALSALFYLADENFEMFYKASAEAKKKAEEKDITEIKEDEINFDTLHAYLKKRYPDRDVAPPENVSLLVAELHRAGYGSISQLDVKLENTEEAVRELEKEVFRQGDRGFHNVGMVRNALSIVDKKYDQKRIKKLKAGHIDRKGYRHFID